MPDDLIRCPPEYALQPGGYRPFHKWQIDIVALDEGARRIKIFSTCKHCRAFVEGERMNLTPSAG